SLPSCICLAPFLSFFPYTTLFRSFALLPVGYFLRWNSSDYSSGRTLVHHPAAKTTVSRPYRLLPRLFRLRILYRFDYRFADHYCRPCAGLLSKLSGERVGAIISQSPTRP